uniref:class II D-tagatose-bisphosphate aldolase non-catalytic subunit n=1 Tax=Shigella flexneri TaxID=623 RepID=UPI002027EB42
MKTLIARHKAGEHIGICSVCSAHPLVIEAALAFDRNSTRKVLIEATSNQVNQFGGYTGMKWHTEFGHLNRGDMLTSEQHRCSNE